MKPTILVSLAGVFLCANAAGAFAQQPTSESPLHSMVATERAFAKTSAEKGTRESFLMFIADDGILFRPTAVLGKKWLLDHPAPASAKRPLLAWQPTFAEMAASGDMGYTFGPWEFKADINDAKPSAFGHFATIWKRQADGSWRFAVDLGISHPQSATRATAWEPRAGAKARQRAGVEADGARDALLNRDREFSKASVSRGARAAFSGFTDENVRLFRNDHLPFVGKQAIAEALGVDKGVVSWEPAAGDVARSGELGYTYGTYEVRTGSTVTAKGNYLRVWKKQGGVWKVVLDVDDPLPLEEKKQQ